ncbi:allantoinase PuuE [Pararhizobium haloflavum]|uniref:allantoinase PuuE n=1 Tax=Pararhizobium haloflavum TaxID=2037914 RepID=UPI000C19E78C|nr:allantoinase PuuE [Pararhizobium haloflavum]
MRYPRDLHGYGETPPHPQWPGGAVIAVQFVVNYEEGGENCVLHGDAASEAFLSEIPGAQPWPGQRHWNMESVYEYGARAGFWRLHRLLTRENVPVTVYGVAEALRRSPAQVAAMQAAGWEIASHGLKWIDYRDHGRNAERADMDEAIRLHAAITGERPAGWYTGRCSENTVDLVTGEGGFAYVSDSYADDLPYWHEHAGRHQLVVPYTLETNDMRFSTISGFAQGEDFYAYLRDAFDTLHAEGMEGSPKMLSIGLHCRLAGRPGRLAALKRLISYMKGRDRVWFATRLDIANHWRANHPPVAGTLIPSRMERADFVSRFGGVFEHSPWIAERAFDGELGPANDTADGLHFALKLAFRLASDEEKLGVLQAHPDLAGKLAAAKRLTAESTAEQAGAGLDALSDSERARFTVLNDDYQSKFGFPFIIAVKGLDRHAILAAFERRIGNDRETEVHTAAREVEKIALLRLRDLFSR